MFSDILVALDGSKHSIEACELAGEIANIYRANVILLTVIAQNYISKEFERFIEKDKIDESEALNLRQIGSCILDEAYILLKERKVASIERVIDEGFASDVILRVAVEKNCDLIVLGTRGLGDHTSLVLGSVSNRVVKSATCSVLTVK